MKNILNSLAIVALAAIAFANACTQKEVAPSVAEQNKNQIDVSLNASTQNNVVRAQPHTSKSDTFKPQRGYVPDEQTAISIAVAVWIPIYGKKQIESEKPYKAILKDNVWTVTGSLPEGYNGGTAVAEISKDDGCVLRIIHYQ